MVHPPAAARPPAFGRLCRLGLPALLAGLGSAGCVDSTGGERVRFRVEAENVALAEGQAADFVDEQSGWAVHLDVAALYLGPLYLWSDEPQLDVNGVGYVDPVRRLPAAGQSPWGALLGPSAHAAGADQLRAGNLRGELTEQVRVDLLTDTTVALGEGTALAGPARSAELWLEPVSGDETLRLRGVARRGAEALPFALELSYDDDWVDVAGGDSPTVLRRLRGLLLSAELAEGGLLSVSVDHRRFFAGVDWASLLDAAAPADTGAAVDSGAPAEAVVLTREDDVGDVISRRVRQVGSSGPWALTWSPAAPPGG